MVGIDTIDAWRDETKKPVMEEVLKLQEDVPGEVEGAGVLY